MNTDTAILMLIADLQRTIETLRTANAALTAENEKLKAASK